MMESPMNPAAMSYWQELFDNQQLSPPEYKYLFPELSNVANETVKELLDAKLTEEMSLMEVTDWLGLDAVGLTAFWLKLLSEPKIPQLKKCKLLFVSRVLENLAGTGLFPPKTDGADRWNKSRVARNLHQSAGEVQRINLNKTIMPTGNIKVDEGKRNTQPSRPSADVLQDNIIKQEAKSIVPSQQMPSNLMNMSESFPNQTSIESNKLEDDSSMDIDPAMWTETAENAETIFSCMTCHYKSNYKSRIKQHIRSVHSSVRPYKCDFCDHTTAVRASLTKHINAVHRKIKPFSCSLCSYTCSLKSSLDVHMSGVHQKSYRHTCPHCDYSASAKNVIDIHIKAVHMKEKPYKCPKPGCDYSSAYPQYIPKHIAAVHDRSKPFACPHCPYRSSYKAYLQKHCDAVHNNIKPYACTHCSYTTSYPQYLNKHISAVHRDEKPHKCPYCQFRCAYKQYISKHIDLVHSSANKTTALTPLDDTLTAIGGTQAIMDVAKMEVCADVPMSHESEHLKLTDSAGNGIMSESSIMQGVSDNSNFLPTAWPELE